MKTKVKGLTIIFACLIAIFIVYSVFSAGTKNRPVISDAERALAVIEVQNTFSKHAYYHAAGKHTEELADIWVKEDGPYAATVTWKNESGIIEGMDSLKIFYGENLEQNKKNLLEQISKIVPEIKNVPENLGVGYEYSMHFQTTPIIEIAGDGKTAKGIWYSPGIRIGGSVLEGGETTMDGGWWMEKYGVDFVKEDGEWKIWHVGMYYDHTPPGWTYENGQATYAATEGGRGGAPGAGPQALVTTKTDAQLEIEMRSGAPGGAPGGGAGGGIGPGAITSGISMKPNPDPYQAWSPLLPTRIQPRFPEPYYTFSETFSY